MYKTLNSYLRDTFGCKVYKLSLSGGMTCPNRDGTVGYGGCIFCSAEGSGDFAEPLAENVWEQIEKAKQKVASKIRDGRYIAYFQDFTNTYAPCLYLKKLFYDAISHPDIVVLSIATRPDCLPDSVIELLSELNRIKPVWVELGLQTVHNSTARYIRRGYELSTFDRAVKKLKEHGIGVVVHMMLGLPFETEQMMYDTAEYIGRSRADGIKFHMLHILKGTDIEKDYSDGKFSLPSLEEYTKILAGCIRRIPPDMTVHRITGDGDKRKLIAPLWTADKKRVLNYINGEFEKLGLIQGDLFQI